MPRMEPCLAIRQHANQAPLESQDLTATSGELRAELASFRALTVEEQRKGESGPWGARYTEEDEKALVCINNLLYVGSMNPKAGFLIPTDPAAADDARKYMLFFKKFCMQFEWCSPQHLHLMGAIGDFTINANRHPRVKNPVGVVNWLLLCGALADKVVRDNELPKPEGQYCILWQHGYFGSPRLSEKGKDRWSYAAKHIRSVETRSSKFGGDASTQWVCQDISRAKSYICSALIMKSEEEDLSDEVFTSLLHKVVRQMKEMRKELIWGPGGIEYE